MLSKEIDMPSKTPQFRSSTDAKHHRQKPRSDKNKIEVSCTWQAFPSPAANGERTESDARDLRMGHSKESPEFDARNNKEFGAAIPSTTAYQERPMWSG
jgi:hypothetical protein